MNKKEVENLIVTHLSPFFIQNGFKLSKADRTQIMFVKKTGFGFVEFALSTINYADSHNMRFGYGIRLDVVEDIVMEIAKKIQLPPPAITPKTTTVNFGYHSYYGIKTDGGFPYMESEAGVVSNMKIVTDFSESIAFPLIEKLIDVREIDKRVNGVGENFWDISWQKPFGLGSHFYLRRRIIAKLSGRKDYDEFIDRLYNIIDDAKKAKGKEPFDRTDLNDDINYCVYLLKDVKPLY